MVSEVGVLGLCIFSHVHVWSFLAVVWLMFGAGKYLMVFALFVLGIRFKALSDQFSA